MVSKSSGGASFEIDISCVSSIEIVCYYVDGTASGVQGGGSYAYGVLFEGMLE